jgi:small-conductance mechanosensitive channel
MISALLFGAALAFGLGARTSISNILGAYYVKKSLNIGDKVEIGENKGVIVKIDDHAVSLETKTGILMIPAKDFNEMQVSLIKKLKS